MRRVEPSDHYQKGDLPMTKPHDGWTPQVQEQEQPPVFPKDAGDPCPHRVVFTWTAEGLSLWACSECHVRFYPACRTCVDVGHRNIEHVQPASAALLREALEASMNDIGLGTAERLDRATERIRAATDFIAGRATGAPTTAPAATFETTTEEGK